MRSGFLIPLLIHRGNSLKTVLISSSISGHGQICFDPFVAVQNLTVFAQNAFVDTCSLVKYALRSVDTCGLMTTLSIHLNKSSLFCEVTQTHISDARFPPDSTLYHTLLILTSLTVGEPSNSPPQISAAQPFLITEAFPDVSYNFSANI